MNRVVWTKKKAALAIALCAIIAVSSVMFLQNNQITQAAVINPHPGLVGWWRFDEGSGTIAGDSSGNGNNGTIYGATWVTGKYGQALNFGTNNYVLVQNAPSLFPSMGTISMWIKITASGSTMTLYSSTSASEQTGGQELTVTSNLGIYGLLGVSGGYQLVQTPSNVLTSGQWYYITFTWTNSLLTLYVNGVSVASNSWTGTQTNPGTNPHIGSYMTGSISMNGIIDEVQIYNRALSATEIQSNFQQSPDLSPYLLANVPQGATQVITTLSWQGTGNINVTITTPSQTYTESMMSEYQKTTYSTTGGGPLSMLNIKRLSISVTALPSAQSWNITLTYDNTVSAYQLSVETQ